MVLSKDLFKCHGRGGIRRLPQHHTLFAWMLLKSSKPPQLFAAPEPEAAPMASTPPASQPPAKALQWQSLTGTQIARLTKNSTPHFQPSQCRLQSEHRIIWMRQRIHRRFLRWRAMYPLVPSDGTVSRGVRCLGLWRWWHRECTKLGFCQQGVSPTPVRDLN